ncbi:arginyl-tRNA synthetase [Coriobacterium glomerans PW2]|uniref:Arginine--tRNA ligase n=1 Tax=Coriobacterium glomerans (strain ATCC 49209 / DSM 20642 / JCM 10262 / PW2) TaxID=700015 RepID=F2N867_CORGP|nr:arginine--tRNA ligase [Coriobacterium glomerans]AEB07250.1 arginyl-tRNA synthetase [Coriobacterium glomerans PW2]
MPELIENLVREAVIAAQSAGDLPAFALEDCGVERPADTSNGEWTSTVALRSAKAAGIAPRAFAEAAIAHMRIDPSIERVEIAGPGFINFYLSTGERNAVFARAREQGADFARSSAGAGIRLQVEFVSANPVGPLHIGHGRWAALGDSLSRVMEHAGYDVEREYYVNDHGNQMDVFGSSISMRYMQLVDIVNKRGVGLETAVQLLSADRDAYIRDDSDEHPELHPYSDRFIDALGANSYGGEYIIETAADLFRRDGDAWAGASESERMSAFREQGHRKMLDEIRDLCHDVRCDFDVWFSERSLYEKATTGPDAGTSAVDRAFARLREMGYIYESAGAVWFRSTDLGDDKDRVLVKANGDYTYFASDVAYHWDKFQRVDHAIDIWGSDHHGYIGRVRAACDALGYPGRFEVLLGQLVNLLRSGKPVRMSKRKGTMVTFRELVDEVGADATRYTLISRSANQTIDFDIDAVKERSMDNPVYYVQYAHARICSILRRAAGVDDKQAALLGMDAVAARSIGDRVDYALLTDPTEFALSRKLSELEELVVSCARDRAPFRLTHFAEELAADFHSFYGACQVLPSETRPVDAELSRARLAACDAVRSVLSLVLGLIGVSAPESM